MYTLLYADDTLVLAESPEQLQLALNEVGTYCNTWGLSINQTKTKVVIFSRGKVRTNFHFKIGNFDIGTTSDYCYLGVLFNFNGKFTKAINDRITTARKAMFGLNEKAVNLYLIKQTAGPPSGIFFWHRFGGDKPPFNGHIIYR